MSRECPKKPNRPPPPYTKVQIAMTQPIAPVVTTEVATTQLEMDEEKVN